MNWLIILGYHASSNKDVAPGPSILTRILESSSGEPLATKLELWSH